MVYICIFYIVLVINFMILNCLYYIWVKGDPSLAGRFDLQNHVNDGSRVFIAPIIITLLLLVFYYSQYLIAMQMGCFRLRSKEVKKSRKVMFIIGQ